VGVLRGIEQRIESLVEGIFGRAFRAHVQPVELARKLVKEMDDHRSVSVSRVYVPNEYVVYLSPRDREQFQAYEGSLVGELAEYLAEHARREGYALLSAPRVLIQEDADLAVGEFGIATRLVQPPPGTERPAAPAPAPPPPARPPVDETKVFVEPMPAPAPPNPPPATPTIVLNGARLPLSKAVTSIGRSKECDVTLDDGSVSRRHAEVHVENGQAWILDLGSTNGTEVNGARAQRTQLEDGDRIVIGQTELRFERS
jgi:Protein of unknown function (DUF3662)/FHA domain